MMLSILCTLALFSSLLSPPGALQFQSEVVVVVQRPFILGQHQRHMFVHVADRPPPLVHFRLGTPHLLEGLGHLRCLFLELATLNELDE